MANKKKIPNPPGGELVCSDNQMPIVKVRNGEVFAECHSEPDKATIAWSNDNPDIFINWALSVIKNDKERMLNSNVAPRDYELLSSGEYSYIDDNYIEVVVRFKLPKNRQSLIQRKQSR